MKSKMIILAAAATALVSSASAQVEVTITGATSIRSVIYDRIESLYGAGNFTNSNAGNSNMRTYNGTMPSVFTSVPNTPVIVRCSFSGSAAGMQAVQNGTYVSTYNAGDTSTTVSKAPDIAFSDVFPGSANPPIPATAFAHRDTVAVVPFVFAKNGGAYLSSVSGLTRDQALLLMTAGGLMPVSYLGGTGSGLVYLIGRDSSSGTRITTEKCIGFIGTPTLFNNVSGNWVTTNGFSSGSLVAGAISANQEAIGYLGVADFNTITNTSTTLSYNGVPYSVQNVENGKYGIWCYEHMVCRTGLSGNQDSLRASLAAAISDSNYQRNNVVYNAAFVPVADMQVERGADGAVITSLKF